MVFIRQLAVLVTGRFLVESNLGVTFDIDIFWILQLYYQNYQGYTPILTAVRLIPMSVTGVLCNLVVALVIGRIDVVYLIGTLLR